MNDDRKTLTRTAFARFVGTYPATITEAIKRGGIFVGDDNRIDPEHDVNVRFKVEYEAKKKRKTQREETGAKRYDYATEKLKVQTQLLEMKLLSDMGVLIRRDQVEAIFGKVYSAAVDNFLNMADRITPFVVAECNVSSPDIAIAVKAVINKDVARSMKALKAAVEDTLDHDANDQNTTAIEGSEQAILATEDPGDPRGDLWDADF